MPDQENNWAIANSITINVSSDQLWGLISTPSHLLKVHPFLKENPSEDWSGIGSKDVMIYNNGAELHRTITEWNEGRGYKLDSQLFNCETRKEKPLIPVIWEICPEGSQQCRLTTTVIPFRMQQKCGLKTAMLYWLKLRPMYVKYWKSVLKGFKYHLESGKIVKEDQFGPHPYFSG